MYCYLGFFLKQGKIPSGSEIEFLYGKWNKIDKIYLQYSILYIQAFKEKKN